MRLNALTICALILVFTGCAGYQLQQAIDSGDIEKIEKALKNDRVNLGIGGSGLDEYRERQRAAIGILSEHYLQEFLKQPEDEVTLSSFDEYCWTTLPTSSRQHCSEESRKIVKEKQREFERKEAENRQRDIERIKQEIQRGERQITRLSEARVFFSPIQSNRILFSPSISGGDDKYYEFTTFITDKVGNRLVSWWPDARNGLPAAGAIFLEPEWMDDDIGFGDSVQVVGKYLRNQEIRLTGGGKAIVPVFGDVYIFFD